MSEARPAAPTGAPPDLRDHRNGARRGAPSKPREHREEGRSRAADLRQYRKKRSLTNPGWAVSRRESDEVRARGELYLSGRVLEIGCGDKRRALLLGDLVDEYVGLDHPGSIHGLDCVDVLASAYETTLPDATFDGVLCLSVLEHLEEPALAVREALRVLKPGGVAIYSVPLFFHLHEEPRDFFRYTKHGIRHLFTQAGFEIVEIGPLSSWPLMAITSWSYYLGCIRKLPIVRELVRLMVIVNNLVALPLDRMLPQDDRFTWFYVVVARRPAGASAPRP